MLKGKNCHSECPESCTWQMWDYQLHEWKTNEALRFTCEIFQESKSPELYDDNPEVSESSQPFAPAETNGKLLKLPHLLKFDLNE